MKVKTKQTAVFFSESDRTLYKFLMACQPFETARLFLKAMQKVAGDKSVPLKLNISDADIKSVQSMIDKMRVWADEIADQVNAIETSSASNLL